MKASRPWVRRGAASAPAVVAPLAIFALWLWLVSPLGWVPAVLGQLALLGVVGAAGQAWRSAGRRQGGPLGRAWVLLGIGVLTWGVGEAAYGIRLLPVPEPPALDAIAAVVFLVAAIFTISGMAAWARILYRRATGRALLDAVLVAVSFAVITWALVLHRVFETAPRDLAVSVQNVLSPVVEISMLTMTWLVLNRVPEHDRPRLAAVAGGLLALAATDGVVAYALGSAVVVPGTMLDLGWLLAFLLVYHGRPRRDGQPQGPVRAPGARRTAMLLPYLPFCAAQVSFALTASDLGPMSVSVLAALNAMLTLILAGRQIGAQRENYDLTRSLRRMAFHDPLTGLANRSLLADRIERALLRQHRTGRDVALLYLDLDGFKPVNDRYGHATGDALLVQVAERLRRVSRGADTVARLGGDEFAVLVEELTDPAEATALAGRITAAVAAPVTVDGERITVGASVGVVVRRSGETGPGQLLRDADQAMYAAKTGGRGGYVVFAPERTVTGVHPG